MSVSFKTTAAVRYGYGLSPRIAPPDDVSSMLTRMAGPDEIAAAYPIKPFPVRFQEERELGKLRKARRQNEVNAEQTYKDALHAASREQLREMRLTFMRAAFSPDGFRERLVQFWADHFSISARGKGLRFVASSYVEDAIRPHVTGHFRDILKAASLHPVMLTYLDQTSSIGPNSITGKKRNRGLNENLAREILELHTLGVGSAYSQKDVRQFAELLTGLGVNRKTGFQFRPQWAEPGAETVLGHAYGGSGKATLADIHAALDDIASRKDTALHIARKLVVHFVSDKPDKKLVDHVLQAYLATDGDLMAVYSALLEHPRAWSNFGQKAKQPFDFMASSIRAMDVDPGEIANMRGRNTRLYFAGPLQIMGQPFHQPGGPDGWPEPIEDWITPQGLAARVEWALIVAGQLGRQIDPPAFARIALADAASDKLITAAGVAESRREGIALVLASPEFNRR